MEGQMPEKAQSAKTYDRIFSELFGTPWLISEEWMMTIIEIARREGDLEAVALKRGKSADNADKARIYGSTAVIPIRGPIFPKSNIMTELSGATSIEILGRDLDAMVKDDSVERIILDIDSPGGHVTGVNEMANIIRSFAAEKDIISYVSGSGASAAYWLAAAGTEIVLDATSRVGSIGVVVAYPKSEGDVVEIVNSASPNKRPDVSTEKGRKVVEDQMNALADVFIGAMAEFRDVSVKTVKNDFGEGGILVGQHAVDAGMADRLGSFEQLLNENGGVSMSGKAQAETMTLETLKADHSQVYDKAYAEGVSETETSNVQIIADKDKTIKQLETDLATANEENTNLSERVGGLEKANVIRDEKDNVTSADNIITAQLSASTLPARMHSKVQNHISADSFITDGKLDKAAFTEHVTAEITDWEETLTDNTNSIQGLGSQTPKDKVDTEKDDAIVAEMVKLSGAEAE